MRTLRRYWLQLVLSTLVLGLALAYASGGWRTRVLEQLDLWLYDARLVLTAPGGLDPRVVIVDIDERSVAELGRWPWPRQRLAGLVDALVKARASVIGFDVVFAETDESSGWPVLQELARGALKADAGFRARLPGLARQLDYDGRFAASLRGQPVLLGYYFHFAGRPGPSGALPAPALSVAALQAGAASPLQAVGYGGNLPRLVEAAAGAGHFNPLTDADGSTRRLAMLVEFQGQYYESLSLAMVRRYLGGPAIVPVFGDAPGGYAPLEALRVGPLQIPVDESVRSLIPYRGPPHSFRYVAAADVLQGRIDPALLAGRMVLVGTSAPGLLDLRSTPVAAVFPGVEIHANLIAAMLDGHLPAQPGYLRGAEVLLLLGSGLLMIGLLLRLRPLPASALALLLLLAVLALNAALWHFGRLAMPLAASLLSLTLLYAIAMVCGYVFEVRNKRQMARLFGQYVPPELVERMSEAPDRYSMEGQSRELTVLFADVRGFTSIAETMPPRELARFMNEFLTVLSELIRNRHLGTIDKYMGDCVMAFWGAPLEDAEHASHALAAALDMQQAVAELGPRLAARGWPAITIGIGINTGRMTVGDMGSQIRKAYTVLGDAVNLASRLEPLGKYYGVGIVLGEATRRAAGDSMAFRELDRVRVKGKDEAVTIYQPLGPASQLDEQSRADLLHYEQALVFFRAQAWDDATAIFDRLQQHEPDKRLYALYQERILHFRAAAPAPDWDGVHEFEQK